MKMGLFLRLMFAGLAVFTLAACDPTADLEDPPVDLGEFRLGHNIVVAPDPELFPGTRKATEAEWQDALTRAIDARFGRYQGTKLYHFGVSVSGYNLAVVDIPVPGIPSQKSVLGLQVTLWDDAKGGKVNEKPEKIFVIGGPEGAGINPDKQVQLDHLAALAAKSIERWLVEHPEWFGIAPES